MNTRPFKEEIKETKTYKSLTKFLKTFTLKRNSIKILEHGVTVATNIGYEKWEKQSNYHWRHKEIVNDILNNRNHV